MILEKRQQKFFLNKEAEQNTKPVGHLHLLAKSLHYKHDA